MAKNVEMNGYQARNVLEIIDQEGFDYCFLHYTDFKEIKDKKFHKLIDDYVEATKKLENYINEKTDLSSE